MMKSNKMTFRLSIMGCGFFCFIGLLLLQGCLNIDLEPKEVPVRYFVLSEVPEIPSDPDPAGDRSLKIGIRPIEMNDYLTSSMMAKRIGLNEIQYSELDRWGEDLDRSIGRVVGNNLQELIAIDYVTVFPWKHKVSHDYILNINVLRFEGTAEGGAVADFQWDIYTEKGEQPLVSKRTRFNRIGWDESDYGALVTLLNDSLLVLSRDIATSMQMLELAP